MPGDAAVSGWFGVSEDDLNNKELYPPIGTCPLNMDVLTNASTLYVSEVERQCKGTGEVLDLETRADQGDEGLTVLETTGPTVSPMPPSHTFTVVPKGFTAEQIRVLVPYMVSHDPASFLDNNRQLISDIWLSCSTPSCGERTTEDYIVGAFDELLYLSDRDNSDVDEIRLRFAYGHLIQAITALNQRYNDERRKRIVAGKSRRDNGSIAIDIYREAKQLNSRNSRRNLSRHIRLGRRWTCLTGSSPLGLAAYSKLACEIM